MLFKYACLNSAIIYDFDFLFYNLLLWAYVVLFI